MEDRQPSEKQPYEKPVLRKVKLEVKTSVLAVCNTTTVFTPQTAPGITCSPLTGCYTPS